MPYILVVDDEPSLAELLADILAMEGYPVRTACNGQEALQLLHQELPALILLDLLMPIMDGRAFLRERQRQPGLAAVPVIAMSALREGAAMLEELHVQQWVKKPYKLDEVLRVVRAHLQPEEVRRG